MTSENAAPAEMPGETVERIIRDWYNTPSFDGLDAHIEDLKQRINALFAPILAEKERATEAKYDAASQAIDAIERADAAEARALAAEAALKLVAEQDVTEIALDPDWPRRICAAAIRAQGE